MNQSIESHFTNLDFGIILAYLLLTTWIGHRLRGKQATIKDFFLAGRSLPWPAVCASIIATEISALTFIGVPGMVFAATGNFTYLQWAIGSIIARVLVGLFLVKLYYEKEIFSPYDFMAARLGLGIKAIGTTLFALGSVLGQSVRLLVTALILRVVTPLDMMESILVITLFAIVWTLMGGMSTVIWTDAIQFLLFIFSGILALTWLITHLDGGWGAMVETASAAGKLKILDLRTDPAVEFTLWVGILAMPFQNLAAFGTDQLNAQRMFCCRSAGDARKAIIWSSLSQVVTVLMLMVGAALFVHYAQNAPTPEEAALFAQDHDTVFPVWITTDLPPGLTGLVLAGAFAAAISSLDSALCALAQTSVSLIHRKQDPETLSQEKVVRQSRIAVILWGVALAVAAIALNVIKEQGQINLLSLAFGMISYTYGPMLALLLLAIFGVRIHMGSLWAGIVVSVLLTLWIRPDLTLLAEHVAGIDPARLEFLRPPFKITYAWLYPINCLLTVFIAWGGSKLFSSKETQEA
jgi:SSS family solute:Na+ symporter